MRTLAATRNAPAPVHAQTVSPDLVAKMLSILEGLKDSALAARASNISSASSASVVISPNPAPDLRFYTAKLYSNDWFGEKTKLKFVSWKKKYRESYLPFCASKKVLAFYLTSLLYHFANIF